MGFASRIVTTLIPGRDAETFTATQAHRTLGRTVNNLGLLILRPEVWIALGPSWGCEQHGNDCEIFHWRGRGLKNSRRSASMRCVSVMMTPDAGLRLIARRSTNVWHRLGIDLYRH